MIGNTLVVKSSTGILYPSISVCSKVDIIDLEKNQTVFQHYSLNLSKLILRVEIWQRNITTGELQKIVIEPMDGKLENRDWKMSNMNSFLMRLPFVSISLFGGFGFVGLDTK